MSTNFVWSIANMERTQEQYVTIVHWRVTGDDETNTASAYGTISFQQEEGEEIIPFADLTEDLVWGWVDEKMERAEVEANVQKQLDELANPPLVSGLPW